MLTVRKIEVNPEDYKDKIKHVSSTECGGALLPILLRLSRELNDIPANELQDDKADLLVMKVQSIDMGVSQNALQAIDMTLVRVDNRLEELNKEARKVS